MKEHFYTIYFNKKYKTVGHLFQGRYKAILVDRDKYLLSLIKYIHLNPVRARISKTSDEYQWSSHHSYIKKADKNDVIDTDQVLRMFSEDKTEARKLYRDYMAEGPTVKKEEIYSTIEQQILGDEKFLDKVTEISDIEIRQKKRKRQYTLPEITRGVEKVYGITFKQILEKSKTGNISLGRKLLSLVANEYTNYGL